MARRTHSPATISSPGDAGLWREFARYLAGARLGRQVADGMTDDQLRNAVVNVGPSALAERVSGALEAADDGRPFSPYGSLSR